MQLDNEQRDLAKHTISKLAKCTSGQEQAKLDDEWTRYLLMPLSDTLGSLCPALVERKVVAGRVQVVPVAMRLMFWATWAAAEFPTLAVAASKLLAMHVTTCSSERNWSVWGQVYTKGRSRLSISLGEKIVYIRGNATKPGEPSDEAVAEQIMMEVD